MSFESPRTGINRASDASSRPPRRKSAFREMGLGIDGHDDIPLVPFADSKFNAPGSIARPPLSRPAGAGQIRSIAEDSPLDPPLRKEQGKGSTSTRWFPISRMLTTKKMTDNVSSSPQSTSLPRLPYLALLFMLFALVIPGFRSIDYGSARLGNHGVDAAVVKGRADEGFAAGGSLVVTRQDASDPSSMCKRFSHQSAIVNDTLYIYGGRAMTDQDQEDNQWNNDFLSLSLGESFQIGTPTLKTLPKPSGPPPVANGYLWHSLTSLFLYGGEFSDNPATSPVPFSTWEYNIKSSSWKEHENPKTSGGVNSADGDVPVQRAAEGAGLNVPELGRGYYFGGHLDGYTTPGWSQSIARVYIKSLLEYTFPGSTNDAVESLGDGKTAGDEGVYRNITEGGLQAQGGFPERADGILVYVPGWGQEGVILGLAGGSNKSFAQMNVIDVYDVAGSTWYKQATSGETPKPRVNPCAVVAAAADGSSFNVYMYGGQDLIPYKQQEQYEDVWILSIPSFTWIEVDTKGQSSPPPRAGHSCNIWDGQMIVVGGYVGQDLLCDSPGVYVFDLSGLEWQTSFTSLKGGNPQNQQLSQENGSQDDHQQPGLSGSYGYKVPPAVQSIVGGHTDGGATVTAPVQSPTEGPLATGKPPTFTVTQGGSVTTQTGAPGQQFPGGPNSQNDNGPNIGAIVAGVVAGVFAIAAVYFAFCAWVYRRQLVLYKRHVAMSQQQAAGLDSVPEKGPTGFAALFRPSSSRNASSRNKQFTDSSSGPSGNSSGGYASVPSQTVPPPNGGNSTTNSSTDDLMAGQEPSFLGVLLSPRRSLRVINRD
ncbi:MAG: hypothetical protein M1837_006111 [Sclerophora amabilis]|nr:MAG: hypothetical protein M1837_006111 [Sclerophora amabilis]